MALVGWQPFPELDTLQQRMNRLFDELTATTDGGGDIAGITFPVTLPLPILHFPCHPFS